MHVQTLTPTDVPTPFLELGPPLVPLEEDPDIDADVVSEIMRGERRLRMAELHKSGHMTTVHRLFL